MPVNCAYWRPGLKHPQGMCAAGVKKNPSPGVCAHCAKRAPVDAKDLIIRNRQGAGDQVLLTAVIRDLHRAFPGHYRTAVDCWAMDLFDHSRYITPRDQLANPREIVVEGFAPGDDEPHLVTQFNRSLARQLNIEIPTTRLAGDIALSAEEIQSPPPVEGRYWLFWAGGHPGFTTKWWSPAFSQEVVDRFAGKLTFVQVGHAEHWHPRLKDVVDMIGKTSMRQTVKLMLHAAGGIGPISFGMHLAAAVPTLRGMPQRRPFIVIAGARESPTMFQYPGQTVLSNVGSLRCCSNGACWHNTAHVRGGESADCEQPVMIEPPHLVDGTRLRIARCMRDITPRMVIDAIERYEAAEADRRHWTEVKNLVTRKAAAESMPLCQLCGDFLGQRAAGQQVACRLAPACCGGSQGYVDLTVGRCPASPMKWDAKQTAAWKEWEAQNA